jgi:two-component system, OmpR family, response regulator
MANRILLVEDDTNFGAVLQSYLQLQGYQITLCRNGNEGYSMFRTNNFDLCILDVMMPLKDGFSLGREIKALQPDLPLIFLTAKTMKDDMMQGYQIGADDYITKPFDSELLLYKIKAVLKRGTQQQPIQAANSFPENYAIGLYRYSTTIRHLSLDEQVWKLSPKEGALLELLCQNRNGILNREEALNKIWHSDNYFTARSMDVYIAKLRKYLKADTRVEIVNIHSNGFRLVCPEI